jgi:hypothetical protein
MIIAIAVWLIFLICDRRLWGWIGDRWLWGWIGDRCLLGNGYAIAGYGKIHDHYHFLQKVVYNACKSIRQREYIERVKLPKR